AGRRKLNSGCSGGWGKQVVLTGEKNSRARAGFRARARAAGGTEGRRWVRTCAVLLARPVGDRRGGAEITSCPRSRARSVQSRGVDSVLRPRRPRGLGGRPSGVWPPRAPPPPRPRLRWSPGSRLRLRLRLRLQLCSALAPPRQLSVGVGPCPLPPGALTPRRVGGSPPAAAPHPPRSLSSALAREPCRVPPRASGDCRGAAAPGRQGGGAREATCPCGGRRGRRGGRGRGGWGGAHVVSRPGVPDPAQPGSLRPLTRLPARRTMANVERTFIAIKPDGVQRSLVGEIIKRFEQKGFRLVAMKLLQASEDLLKQHYVDLKDRPFFPGLVKYMHSGPIVAMVWEGLNVVKTGRVMLGETNPADSKPGTIRGDFCIQVGRNIIHGSDSVKSAEKEISLWFKPEELVDYKSCAFDWIYE
uniref:Nucleoside diphosphate kinase n=1 Tax=Equus caballus TaxID=9796 RepID=A0A9L0SKQ6_HORSE